MRDIFFIGWQDVRFQLRDGSTLLWLFVMPPIFFFFIGTVTSGFSSGMSGAQATKLTVVAENPGFLKEQVDLRLVANDFAPEWVESLETTAEKAPATRTLTFDAGMSNKVVAGEPVSVVYDTKSNSLTRTFEEIRIQRALYTVLADVIIADATAVSLTSDALAAVNEAPRVWALEVSPAGARQEIPSGFEQAVPGILVMFTLLVLLTSGATMLVQERTKGLLRRLASAPMSRGDVIAGKWQGRMVLAAIQVSTALVIGTFLFKMDWGPNLAAVIIVLVAWAGFCASAGLWLGTVAKTDAQAGGLGVLAANLLAALGGCWWPIEVAPDWMQVVQKLIPTGWTMDALHKLISFQAEPMSVLPNVLVLIVAAAVFGVLAARRFQYE
ncbi:MAG: ABC transporter permease [Gammaproteobacteria bacterium]|nr:ABC transporter permease [Gammaproteobacteria bacterium]NNC57398.1 ABC transporter permease [Woeseiaceae bacterium]NNL49586.1 ABC transporter permease [Woeseiaceae bacterium]